MKKESCDSSPRLKAGAPSQQNGGQHRDEQSRIDQLIEQEEKEKNTKPKPCRYEDTAQYAFDQLYNFLDGEPSDFD